MLLLREGDCRVFWRPHSHADGSQSCPTGSLKQRAAHQAPALTSARWPHSCKAQQLQHCSTLSSVTKATPGQPTQHGAQLAACNLAHLIVQAAPGHSLLKNQPPCRPICEHVLAGSLFLAGLKAINPAPTFRCRLPLLQQNPLGAARWQLSVHQDNVGTLHDIINKDKGLAVN